MPCSCSTSVSRGLGCPLLLAWVKRPGLLLHHLCVGRHGEVRNFVLPETFVAVLPTRTLSWLFRGSGEPALVSSGFLGSRAGLFLGPDGQTHFVMKECLWTLRNSAENFILLVRSGSTTRKQAKAYGHVENRTLVVNGRTTASHMHFTMFSVVVVI